MATSVTIDEETKSRLERLQAEITLETGRDVTQREMLARLVDRADRSREEFVESFRETTIPLTDEEVAAFHSGTTDWGVETTDEEIDELLYGEPDY